MSTPYAQQQGASGFLFLLLLLGILAIGASQHTYSIVRTQHAQSQPNSLHLMTRLKSDLIAFTCFNVVDGFHYLPYPDRNHDGNFDGQSDCPSNHFSIAHTLGAYPSLGVGTGGICNANMDLNNDLQTVPSPIWLAISPKYAQGMNPTDHRLLTVINHRQDILCQDCIAVIFDSSEPLNTLNLDTSRHAQKRHSTAENKHFLDAVIIHQRLMSNYDPSDLTYVAHPPSTTINDRLVMIRERDLPMECQNDQ